MVSIKDFLLLIAFENLDDKDIVSFDETFDFIELREFEFFFDS